MAQTMKKTLSLLVVAFLLFYMLTQPQQFADVLRSVGSTLQAGFDQVIEFFNALLDDRPRGREP
jgi:predicted PurR-regulated permease PerM